MSTARPPAARKNPLSCLAGCRSSRAIATRAAAARLPARSVFLRGSKVRMASPMTSCGRSCSFCLGTASRSQALAKAHGSFTLGTELFLPSSDVAGGKVYARRETECTGGPRTSSEVPSLVVDLGILFAARGVAADAALAACVDTPDGGASGCDVPGARSGAGGTPVPARSKRSASGGKSRGLGAFRGGGQLAPRTTCKKVLRLRTLDSDHFLRLGTFVKKSNMEIKTSAGSSVLEVTK